MISGEHISLAIVVVESLSVLMLFMLMVDHEERPAPPFILRVGYLGIAAGLVVHVIGHLELLLVSYRQPRTWSWLLFQVSVNYTIWVLYFRDALPRWKRKVKA